MAHNHTIDTLEPSEYDYAGMYVNCDVKTMTDTGIDYHEMFGSWFEEVFGENVSCGGNNVDGNFENKGTCDLCGTHFTYGAQFKHRATSDVITVGNRCALETFKHDSKMELDRERAVKEMANLRERMKAHAKRVEFEKELSDTVLDYIGINATQKLEMGDILENIKSKLKEYGSLSEKQVALVEKVIKQRSEREEQDSKQEKEYEEWKKNGGSFVVGKGVEITGTILTTKLQESQYGSTLKMLVLAENGFQKLWGSIPSSLDGVYKGDVVKLVANVEASGNDERFFFFKRPRKGEILKEAVA